MTKILADPQPNLSPSAFKIVKELDIWHDEAFVGTPAYGYGNKGERKEKWYVEDSWGNIIADYCNELPEGAVGGEFIEREFYWFFSPRFDD